MGLDRGRRHILQKLENTSRALSTWSTSRFKDLLSQIDKENVKLET